MDSLTRSLALEWGTDYDIRVNGIAPGPIEGTPGTRKLVPEEMKSKTREFMPLFKLGDKWDIAMAALYLASDAGYCFLNTSLQPFKILRDLSDRSVRIVNMVLKQATGQHAE